MAKYSKESNSKLLKIYLYAIFITLILAIADDVWMIFRDVSFYESNLLLSFLIAISLFIFSIYCLVIFIKKKYSRLTWIIPIWAIVEFVITFFFGLGFAVAQQLSGINIENFILSKGFRVINLIYALIQFAVVFYLINRFFERK
jgi:hypothetical protein